MAFQERTAIATAKTDRKDLKDPRERTACPARLERTEPQASRESLALLASLDPLELQESLESMAWASPVKAACPACPAWSKGHLNPCRASSSQSRRPLAKHRRPHSSPSCAAEELLPVNSPVPTRATLRLATTRPSALRRRLAAEEPQDPLARLLARLPAPGRLATTAHRP